MGFEWVPLKSFKLDCVSSLHPQRSRPAAYSLPNLEAQFVPCSPPILQKPKELPAEDCQSFFHLVGESLTQKEKRAGFPFQSLTVTRDLVLRQDRVSWDTREGWLLSPLQVQPGFEMENSKPLSSRLSTIGLASPRSHSILPVLSAGFPLVGRQKYLAQ